MSTTPADVSPCPLCRHTDGMLLYPPTDRHAALLRCPHCTMIWLDPVPTLEELAEFYAQEVPDAGYDELLQQSYWPPALYQQRLATMGRHGPPGKRVLDVGVGFGHFLAAAARERWEPTGVDLSPLAARYVTEQHGIPVAIGDVRHTFRDTAFDAIHAKDVIEHITDPVEELRAYRKLLRPGGLLVIETLNISSLFARVRGEQYPAFIPGHVVFFSPKTLGAAVEKAGFEVARCWAGDEIPVSAYWENLPPKRALPRTVKKLRLGPVYMASFVLYARVPPTEDGP